jgi:hypothetical protein
LQKYITKLDFENEVLIAPAYSSEGKIVDDLLNNKKQWPVEKYFIVHELISLG